MKDYFLYNRARLPALIQDMEDACVSQTLGLVKDEAAELFQTLFFAIA